MSAVPMAEKRSMADGSTGGRARRRWSVARKAAILAELGEPGATLSVVARRHAIASSLLHRWRSNATDERRPVGNPGRATRNGARITHYRAE
jgi:transposase-like protein